MKKISKMILFFSLFLFLPQIVSAVNPDGYKADDDSLYDLTINSISIDPATPAVGQDTQVTVKVKNNGTHSMTSNEGLSNFRSTFTDFTFTDIAPANVSRENRFEIGGYVEYVFEGSFSSAGSKSLYFYVDTENDLVETNEDNNESSQNVTVVSYDTLDVAVDSITIKIDDEENEHDLVVGKEVDMVVKVKNTGDVSLISEDGLFGDFLVFSSNDINDSFSYFRVSSSSHDIYPDLQDPLKPNEYFTYYYTGEFIKSGEIDTSFSVDSKNKLDENNEVNNKLVKTVTVYENQSESDAFETFNPVVELISSSSVSISWQTDKKAIGGIRYQEGRYYNYDDYKKYYHISSWPEESKASTTHSLIIDDLKNGTEYRYEIYGIRNDNTEYYKEDVFNMLEDDTVKLTSGIALKQSLELVEISWRTNLISDSYVYYKMADEDNYAKIGSDDKVFDHEVSISGLKTGVYDYFLSSTSTLGTNFTSENKSFTISSAAGNTEEQENENNDEVIIKKEEEQSSQADDESMDNELLIDNTSMYGSLKGKIMLKVESNGEAYYIHPSTQNMYYLGRPDDAFSVMREQGVGISSANLKKIQIGLGSLTGPDSDGDGLPDLFEDGIGTDKNKVDTDGDGNNDKAELENSYNPNGAEKLYFDTNFSNAQIGKIFLDVENNGEAWYVNPSDGKRYFLGRPADAFQVMRNLGLGISNNDFNNL